MGHFVPPHLLELVRWSTSDPWRVPPRSSHHSRAPGHLRTSALNLAFHDGIFIDMLRLCSLMHFDNNKGHDHNQSVSMFPWYSNFKTFYLTHAHEKWHMFQLQNPSQKDFSAVSCACSCGCDQEHGTAACSGSSFINSKTFFFNMAMEKPPPETLTSNCLPPAVEMCSIRAREGCAAAQTARTAENTKRLGR